MSKNNTLIFYLFVKALKIIEFDNFSRLPIMGKLEKFSSLFRTNRLLILKSFSGENRVNSAPIPVKIDVAKIKRNTLIKYSLTQETRKESSLAACPKTQGKWDRVRIPSRGFYLNISELKKFHY